MNLKTAMDLDVSGEIDRITAFIRETTFKEYRRKGAVIGLSGGIDSAVTAELCVAALGKDKVLALFLPEKESNPISLEYGMKQAGKMGVRTEKVDLTPVLDALGVYRKRNEVIREAVPEFDEGWKFNVSLPQDLMDRDRINYYVLTAVDGGGKKVTKRLSSDQWLRISSYQNMKQRLRMMMLYHFAERERYLVAGTTNRSETHQGFFVKFGDGGVDIEPLAHLYKTQVYRLGEELGVIEEIRNRPPSPDTYSLPVTDKEFYFCIDYELLDTLLYAYEHSLEPDDVATEMGLEGEQVRRVFRDLKNKEQSTWHLRCTPPSLLDEEG